MKLQLVRTFHALTLALLALCLLNSCAGQPKEPLIETRDVIVHVPVVVPLPEAIIADCVVPEFPDPYLVADAKELTAELYSALYECNEDKAEIRELQPR